MTVPSSFVSNQISSKEALVSRRMQWIGNDLEMMTNNDLLQWCKCVMCFLHFPFRLNGDNSMFFLQCFVLVTPQPDF